MSKRVYDRAKRAERWTREKVEQANRLAQDRQWWSTKVLPKIKHRAKMQGHEFSITPEDIPLPDNCPVLGIPLTLYPDKTNLDDSPSVDRIDNTKGYIPGNVRVISNRANGLKSDGTKPEFQSIIEYIDREDSIRQAK